MCLCLRLCGLCLRLCGRGALRSMLEKLTSQLSGFLKNFPPGRAASSPPPGLHSFTHDPQGKNNRVHLRIDEDGHGTLLVNANRFIHLNPTATYMAYHHLSATPPAQTIRALQHTYRVDYRQASRDFKHLSTDIENFLTAPAEPVYTITHTEVNRPFSHQPSAPYRMDLALTYRCNNDCPHCYNARERDYPEQTTQTWKRIIDQIWDQHIPHIVFTGGEPTLREDLPELIAYAEGKGQITGLNTNARRLSHPSFAHDLVEAGLDHIQITVESHDPAVHDEMVNLTGAWQQTIAGLKNALETPLFVMTNTTMLEDNYRDMGQTLRFLAELGVPTVGLNALIYAGGGKDVGTGLPEELLPSVLEKAKNITRDAGQRLIWYTPTQYCRFNPLDMGLGMKGCTAALYNMCVEPNGHALPCQSYYQSLGHILDDSWPAIWNHPLAVSIRNRSYAPPACKDCSLLLECGGGCPLALEEKAGGADPDKLIPVSI